MATAPASDDRDDTEEPDRTVFLQSLYFAAMTLLTALAFLFVVRALGQQPQLTTGFGSEETTAFTLRAPDGSFGIDLPAEVLWYFPGADHGSSRGAAAMVGDPRFTAALQPLLTRAPDVELLLLAQTESAILAMARSERLGGISVADVRAYAATVGFTGSVVSSTNQGRSAGGTATALLTVEQDTSPPLICRQQVQPSETHLYWATVCAPDFSFDQQSAIFDAILSSVAIRDLAGN
jgi:hypothetical protein